MQIFSTIVIGLLTTSISAIPIRSKSSDAFAVLFENQFTGAAALVNIIPESSPSLIIALLEDTKMGLFREIVATRVELLSDNDGGAYCIITNEDGDIIADINSANTISDLDDNPNAIEPVPITFHHIVCERLENVGDNLGFGGSSTVWLASDQKQQDLDAIKIKSADSALKSQEVDILKYLHSHPLIRQLLDNFIEISLNGAHNCLVMEMASCSLMQSKSLVFHGLLDLHIV
ncbi:hypothetical protein GX50_04892 [[Emmonsia] crescens]|uniref:Protein kinase domain-containing protein n=1 Tax=[Emmonsia] crescens TaxID=73230 RepID=A0A2B7ZHL3_9EURO|nr:hypothetical protein GX50_04892 [Emmonsia crescens]